MTSQIRPFKFKPYLKQVLWGGTKIADFKGITPTREKVGESWELSDIPGHESVVAEGPDAGLTLSQVIAKYGEKVVGKKTYEKFGDKFPILAKIIDANKDLSIQVHPGDEMAKQRHNCFGKTEMWYIVDAEPGAKVGTGLGQVLTPAEFEQCIENKSITRILSYHNSQKGDVYYIPAGHIHSIGAGNLLVEIQQTSDIIYRVFDYGRLDSDGNPRELHTQLAKDAIDYHASNSYVKTVPHDTPGETQLVKCEYFDVHHLTLDDNLLIDMEESHEFMVLMCLGGELVITDDTGRETKMRQGETVLVPAATTLIVLDGFAELLTATV